MALGIADLIAMDTRVSVEAASSAGDPAVTTAARRLTTPTLVINGREDQLFPPAASSALAQALPVSAHIFLDRCGHIPMAERPGELYGLLGSFMLEPAIP
jgi:pimeloyl-ACP methyl ester carboxylesterase